MEKLLREILREVRMIRRSLEDPKGIRDITDADFEVRSNTDF